MINYHPIIGIAILFLCILFSFILGRKIMLNAKNIKNKKPPKGEVSSPDAPWLKKN